MSDITTEEAIRQAKAVLKEATQYENSVCEVTDVDAPWIRKAIEALENQKTGHWITTRTFMHDGEFYCDKCKCESPNNKKWDYCPNCGARMEGINNEICN